MNRKGNIKKIFALFAAIAVLATAIPLSGITSQAAAKKASKITLSKSSATMLAGSTLKLKVKKVSPSGASKAVTWKTSNKKRATVTASGVVKAKKAGTVRITAVSKANPKAKASCKITIYNKTKKLQLVSSKSYTLSVGVSMQLEARVTSPASRTQPVRWTSSNADVASISKTGLVKAVSKGTAKMTAKSGGKSVSVNITVEDTEIPEAGYIVTFDTAGGSAVASQSVAGGSTAVKPADPVREGYTFGGWYTDSTLTAAYDFASPVTGNLTLYAKWDAVSSVTYKVAFQTNGGNAITEQTVRTGEKVTKPEDPVKFGFEFAGWYSDSFLKQAYDFDAAVTQDITLYARWRDTGNGSASGSYVPSWNTSPSPAPSPSVYTVTFNSNGGSTVASQTVTAGGKAVKPEDPAREGYTFAGWFTDEALSKAFDFSASLSTSLTLYAKWTQNANQGGNGVTREQWIAALSELFDLPQTADGQHSFDDFAELENQENRNKIEASIRRGFVQLKADTDNMVFFHPKESATKEFAAYTAIRALELSQAGTGEDPKWADTADLAYPKEDLLAVNAGIVQVNGNRFEPNALLTDAQMEQALNAVRQILSRAAVSGEPHGEISYVDGVSETELAFELNETEQTVTTDDTAKTADWKAGEVHVIKSSDGTQDIAVKITDIRTESGKTVIRYEAPELEEVVTSFDASGMVSSQGTFTPAEGITVEDSAQTRQSRAVAADEIPLFGKKNIIVEIDGDKYTIGMDIQSLEYRFAASPSWHLVTIDEVYLALNSALELKTEIASAGVEATIPLGEINVSVGYGFFVTGELNLKISASGKVEVGVEFTQKLGVQYAKNHGIRPVYKLGINPLLNLQAEVKGGLELEVNANLLKTIKIAAVGGEGGLAAEGTPKSLSLNPFQFCLDTTEYLFLTFYSQIGPDGFNIRNELEIFNSDNSIWRRTQHYEETGRVEECTRGSGDYEGYVRRADNDVPIHNAKIQVVQDGRVMDTTYSDIHGHFKGLKLNKGTYKVRVSAAGYRPYEQTFEIMGGQTTSLETQLMIANEEELTGRSCSGMVTDSFTGLPLSGAELEVYSNFLFGNNERIAQTVSGEDGTFEFHAPVGSYKVTVKKEGYVENTIDIVVIRNRDDLNIFLSPQNQQPVVGGNLRAVLHWGMTPQDLDSHMVGPTEDGGTFHVFYQEMEEPPVMLDVDDVDGEGPEEISVTEMVDGRYSYYIHDYTNRDKSSSTELSNSGAYIDLYTGNTRLGRISIPQNREGTVWHVFDYDTETGRVQLVNAFSYESEPELVGNRSGVVGRSSGEVLKDYEREGQN